MLNTINTTAVKTVLYYIIYMYIFKDRQFLAQNSSSKNYTLPFINELIQMTLKSYYQ